MGMEKSLVAQLLKKAIDNFNNEMPYMILSVFNCAKNPGSIFVESYNKFHVTTFV